MRHNFLFFGSVLRLLKARPEVDDLSVLEQETYQLDVLVRHESNQFSFALTLRDYCVAEQNESLALKLEDLLGRFIGQKVG